MRKIGLIVGVVGVVLVAAGVGLVAVETRLQVKEVGVPAAAPGAAVTPPVPVPLSHSPLAQQLQPTSPVIAQNPKAPNLTAGWKVYRNEQYGFELQYPPEYGFKEMSGKGVKFTGDPELVLFFGKLGNGVDHHSFVLDVFNTPILFVADAYSDRLEKATLIMVDGRIGFRIFPNQAGGESVYVQKDDKVILNLVCSPSELCPETEREIFDQVIETLKFQTSI